MNTVIDRLSKVFSPDKIFNNLIEKLLPDIIVAVTTFLIFFIIWRIFKKILSVIFKRLDTDLTVQSFITSVLKYFILIIGFVTALSQIGINTGSIIASLGVAGLTIGFAAKDALSNIISGLFIFWDRPFAIGDLIEIGGHYGRVDEITMRSTRIITVDGKMLAVPNSQILNSMVSSYTNFPHLRLDINFTVSVDENIDRIRSILLGIAEGNESFMKAPPPALVVESLNDYNIQLCFRIWIDDEREHIRIRYELREKLLHELRNADVSMPFETLDIILHNNKNT